MRICTLRNCVLEDMLPSDTCNSVDDTVNMATVNIVPDLCHSFVSSVSNEKSMSSSSCDVDNDDNQNFICKIIVVQLNINSIRNKFEQLVENINKNIDILLIVETKLDDSFPINQFHIEGYQQFRVDRSCHGGGLLFYIRNNIPAK